MQKIKVFIVSYDRPDTHTTYFMLKKIGVKSTVVVHTEEMREKYIACNMPAEDIIASNAPKGISNNRNYIIDNLVEEGEWCVHMCDDMVSMDKVEDKYYLLPEISKELMTSVNWHKQIETADEFYAIFEEMAKQAEFIGASYCGTAIVDNNYFRCKKFLYGGLVDGRTILLKKNHLRFNNLAGPIDDLYFTALNLLNVGVVLRNNYVLFNFKRYSTGGYGTQKKRFEERKRALYFIEQEFPDLFRVFCDEEEQDIDFKFNLFTKESIDKWRLKMIIRGKLDPSHVYSILNKQQADAFISKFIKK